MNITNFQALSWSHIKSRLDEQGHALLPNLVDKATCDQLKSQYNEDDLFRKTVIMERHRYGLGSYRYYKYPIPEVIREIRSNLYPHLAEIANYWMKALRLDRSYTLSHEEFLGECHREGQLLATPLILKYGQEGFNTLHQDIYGPVYFPLQAVIFLSEYDVDYQGGEFVMTEQVPRAQSKAIVMKPGKGDVLIFATNFRPVKGQKGYYRANMRHGVSTVTSGSRFTLGIIFHDALK